MAQKEIFVAHTSELKERDRKIIPHGNTEIGVYRANGKLYAYQNLCAHQGGPACEGLLMPKVEDVIARDQTYQGQKFNYEELHIVCPWHGFEYDLTDGVNAGNKRFHLKKYEVEVRKGGVYVLI